MLKETFFCDFQTACQHGGLAPGLAVQVSIIAVIGQFHALICMEKCHRSSLENRVIGSGSKILA